MPKIDEIEYFDFPSNHLEEKTFFTEKFLVWANRKYPWLKWLLGVVAIISVLHYTVL